MIAANVNADSQFVNADLKLIKGKCVDGLLNSIGIELPEEELPPCQ